MGKLGITTTYKDVENLAVGEVLERSAEIVPNKVCISFKEDRITYRELNAQTNAIAASLQEMGISKGDRVAIYMSPCPELYIAFYALQKIGAIVAWANPAYKTQELTFILSNSQARAVFVQKGKNGFDNFGLVQELRPNLPHLSHVISIGGGQGEGFFPLKTLSQEGKKDA
jgi:acyl-CoA synthetase (AMP-forming)/AMP-acid ligase II